MPRAELPLVVGAVYGIVFMYIELLLADVEDSMPKLSLSLGYLDTLRTGRWFNE